MDGVDDYYDLHEKQITTKGHEDANPTDPVTKAELDAWLADWNEVKSGWAGLKSGFQNLGSSVSKQVSKYDSVKSQWDPADAYN